MKQLSKKRKVEIADAILDNSEFVYSNANLRHLRKIVREMIIEAIDTALVEADKQ